MRILVAEREMEVPPAERLFALRDRVKPDADVVICNGAPAAEDTVLTEGDSVVFIRRGEQPSKDELEALMIARHSPGVHQRIKRAVVGIAGLGGLGSPVAIALCRLGIGKLILADFDVVEPSNLNRQQYFVDQIGQRKSAALTANLRRINPYVDIEAHDVRLDPENVGPVFAEADVVVEAFDRAEEKGMLMEACSRAFPNRPLVMASGLAGYGPGGTLGVHRMGPTLYIAGDLQSAARPGQGLMAPRVGVVAHLQANIVLRLLLGEEGA